MSDDSQDQYHGGDALVQALHSEGITHVFGIPGGEFIPFLEAVDRWGVKRGMRYINCRHEEAAGHMADAFARVTGKPAVACGTVGPGFLNMVSAITAAAWDNVPMLVVHPQQGPKFEDHHRLQGGLDQLAILKPVVKYQKSISDPNRIIWAVQKCFKELFCGKPGVVQLELREDALHAQVEDYGRVVLPPGRYRATEAPAAHPASVKNAADMLLAAKKPVIVSGGGVTASGAWAALRTLASDHDMPVMTTVMGIGTMSSDHPKFVGATLGNAGTMKAASQGDLFLLLGTKLSYVMGYGKSPLWNSDAKVIQVDIDPLMIAKNRPVDLGIIADAGVFLEQLLAELKARKAGAISEQGWTKALQDERAAGIAASRGKLESDKTPIEPRRLIAELTSFMEPDDILCIDGGDIAVLTLGDIDVMKPRAPRTVLQSIGLGCLGTCIPYAIGAKIAAPEKRVFGITGDGSFLFNVQELDTAMKYCTPFVIVIADNCKWGMIENNEMAKYKKREPFCVDICSDYVSIAKGFGCHAERVENPADIKPALQRAVDSGRPAVLQVPIKFVSPPNAKLMLAFSKMKF